MQIVLLVSVVLTVVQSASVSAPPNVDPNTKLVFVGMRHGNRNPENFLKNDPNKGKWGEEGLLQLTQIGKRQGYAVGVNIKERYSKLIPDVFNPDVIKAVSSSAERAQMTLQSCMAAAFAPKTPNLQFNKQLDWQPIPYTINNPMLRMYSVNECQPQADAWKPISDDNLPELKKQLTDNKDLIAYIAKNTGLNGSLSNMADVADNLMNIKMLGLKLPDWVEKSTLPGKTGNIYKDVLKFSESHTIMCANYKPCGRLMGGLWLNDIITTLQKKKDKGDDFKLKMVVYAAHTEITLSVMKLMNMDQKEVPTSAGFILEYRDKPEASIRLIYHEPVEDNPDKRHLTVSPLTVPCKGATSDGWCPLQNFIDNVKPNSFADWQAECKLPSTCNPLSG